MSKHYDVVCLECDADSGLHLNWGAETCRDVIAARDGLALISGHDINVSVSGEIGHIDPAFYRTHAGHVLAPVSEHGDIDGDCNELRPTGEHCTDGAQCRLPAGHEVDHAFEKLARWGEEAAGWKEFLARSAARRRTGLE